MYEKYGHGLGIRILDSAIDYVYGAGVSVVREYAKHSEIPVINMACCTYHPTQGLADLMTVQEALGKVKGKKYVIMWGYSKSFRGRCSIQEEALIMSRFGMDVVLAHPSGLRDRPERSLKLRNRTPKRLERVRGHKRSEFRCRRSAMLYFPEIGPPMSYSELEPASLARNGRLSCMRNIATGR